MLFSANVYHYDPTKLKLETPRSSQYSESNAIPTVIRSDIMKHISYRKERLNRKWLLDQARQGIYHDVFCVYLCSSYMVSEYNVKKKR